MAKPPKKKPTNLAPITFTDRDPIEDLLPASGWFRRYVDFSASLETCTRFRLFTAFCVFGAAINNTVWIHRGDVELLPKLFPNPWILLLAPPGRGHKTSTINMGVNLLVAARPDVRILANKITPEAVVKALASPNPNSPDCIRIGPPDATGLISAPEFSTFFGKQQYNSGLIPLLLDLYDYRERWTSATITRGQIILKDNCISIIGGSTPEGVQELVPEEWSESGLASRFIIIEQPINYHKRVTFPTRSCKATWQDLISEFTELTSIKGIMQWTSEAESIYDAYYQSLQPTGEAQRDAYQERKTEQLLKLAMLLTLSRGEMTVPASDMELAKRLMSLVLHDSDTQLERMTTHPRMRLAYRFKQYLEMHGETSKSKLANKFYRTLAQGESQFNEALRMLIIAREIEPVGGTPGNPIYKLVNRMKIR